jgi:cell division protein FtsI/penicillin-binding protein 2
MRKIVSSTGLAERDVSKVKEQLEKKSRSRKLILWLSQEQHEVSSVVGPYAKARKIPRNALFFIQDYKRSYPYGKLLGQVLQICEKIKTLKHTKTFLQVGWR